jgi:prevent-host-death family protein
MTKNINVNELQAQISSILKDVQKGQIYEVMRYSEPVAVVLSYENYLKLRGECKRCIEDLRKLARGPRGQVK